MTTKSEKSVHLQAVTMIHLATDWIEIHTVRSEHQVELAWLARCPLPYKVIVDRGNEFLANSWR